MSDKRRPDLAIPYVHKPDTQDDLPASVLFKSLPMVAMFMRSKVMAWAALFLSMQSYLAQPSHSTADTDSVTLSNIMTAVMSVGVAYMDFVVVGGRPKTA